MARGNRRERIFRDEADRLLFYQTLGKRVNGPAGGCTGEQTVDGHELRRET